MAEEYLITLEGGGTRSQAVVMDTEGRVLHISEAADVNTNFVSFQDAQAAVWKAVTEALRTANVSARQVSLFVSALVGPKFGEELFGSLIPNAAYYYYGERDVVFARAGIYERHGVAVVAATGATAWGVRADDGREIAVGGWGSLLGDEGSAYAMGLLGMRAAVKAFEGREIPTALIEAICHHFNIPLDQFHEGLVRLAYQKPLSRAEIGGIAVVVTRLAGEGDALACRIVAKVANDLAALPLHVAHSLFQGGEVFPVAAAGGLFNAGKLISQPLEDRMIKEFPHARLIPGDEAPAVALGKLALSDRLHQRR
jgi:N-acetylglucosamine kinase-like BadF-type ATPase